MEGGCTYSLTKACLAVDPDAMFDDCPRLMIIRPFFYHWKAAIIDADRIRGPDYAQMPWLCRIADVEVWVNECNDWDAEESAEI